MEKFKQYAYGLIIFLIIVFAALSLAMPVTAQGLDGGELTSVESYPEPVQKEQPELKKMEATAYYDSYGHGYGADGSKLIEGLTLAARPCDLGKTFIVYNEDYRLIGIYECRDTGYGQSTHYGQSRILPGRSVGTIEAGQCIDIYFKTYAQCKAFGRQTVYVQIIDAEG